MNLEKLNKFLLDLDNKYDINSGACALIAYMLSSWCVKNNISYKTKLYVDYRDYSCIWHYALIINDIEINPSTYEYKEFEEEKYFIEDNWTPKMFKEKYEWTLNDYNYWKIHNEKIVIKIFEDFLNNIEI